MKILPMECRTRIGPDNLDGGLFYATHLKIISFDLYNLGVKAADKMQQIIDWARDYDLSGFRFETLKSESTMEWKLLIYFASEHHATVFALHWSHLGNEKGLTL